MNRRSFFGLAGGVAAAAVVPLRLTWSPPPAGRASFPATVVVGLGDGRIVRFSDVPMTFDGQKWVGPNLMFESDSDAITLQTVDTTCDFFGQTQTVAQDLGPNVGLRIHRGNTLTLQGVCVSVSRI